MFRSDVSDEPIPVFINESLLTRDPECEIYHHVYDFENINSSVGAKSRRTFLLHEDRTETQQFNSNKHSPIRTKITDDNATTSTSNLYKASSGTLFSYNYNLPSIGTSSISTWDETDQYINLANCEEINHSFDNYDYAFEDKYKEMGTNRIFPGEEYGVSDSPAAIYISELTENLDANPCDIAFFDNLNDHESEDDIIYQSYIQESPITKDIKSEDIIHTQPHRLVNPRALFSNGEKDHKLQKEYKEKKKSLSKSSATSSLSSVFSYNEIHLQKIITKKEPITKTSEKETKCIFLPQNNILARKKVEKKQNPEKLKLINYLTIGSLKFKYYYYFNPEEGSPFLIPEHPPLMTVDLISKTTLIKKRKEKGKKKKNKKNQISKRLNKGNISEDQTKFLNILRLKLDRYCGNASGRRSRSQEYFDKVRFQEIFYKFSKTYF